MGTAHHPLCRAHTRSPWPGTAGREGRHHGVGWAGDASSGGKEAAWDWGSYVGKGTAQGAGQASDTSLGGYPELGCFSCQCQPSRLNAEVACGPPGSQPACRKPEAHLTVQLDMLGKERVDFGEGATKAAQVYIQQVLDRVHLVVLHKMLSVLELPSPTTVTPGTVYDPSHHPMATPGGTTSSRTQEPGEARGEMARATFPRL